MPSFAQPRRVTSGWPVPVGMVVALAALGCTNPNIRPADPTTPTPEGTGGAAPGPVLPPPPPLNPDADLSLGEAGPPGPPPAPAGEVVVYAHSGSDLYRVDPKSLEIARVGPFVMKFGTRDRFLNTVTDIAVDKAGRMTGITFNELLDINPATAECRSLAQLAGSQLNGLSWIRTADGGEILAATSISGAVLQIDPASGTARPLGNLGRDQNGSAQKSSGDLVSVASYGTLITLQGVGNDVLARVDPATGVAQAIGPTGFSKVWGIGFWGNRVFGFTQTGEFILIDPKTGAGSLVRKETAFPFWGAGVSTSVPVVD